MGSVEETKKLIDESSNILIVTGAGISTAAGIPDFRSQGGLYDIVKERYNLIDPTIILDINFFINNPSMFYSFAPELSTKFQPTLAHKYIADLEKEHNVIVLTQNIDGLHEKAGSKNVINAHGSMAEAYCLQCGRTEKNPPYDGSVLYCESCGGLMKPNVVFFNEGLPRTFYNFYDSWRDYNFDLMLVIGTGLGVYPVAGLVHLLSRNIKNTIYITKEGSNTLNANVRVEEDIEKFFKKLLKLEKNNN